MNTGERCLDEKGRCCGKKPLLYKRDGHKFCTRCQRQYDIETGKQTENWAWYFDHEWGTWEIKTPKNKARWKNNSYEQT